MNIFQLLTLGLAKLIFGRGLFKIAESLDGFQRKLSGSAGFC